MELESSQEAKKGEIGPDAIPAEAPQGKTEEKAEIKYPHKGTLCLHAKTCYKEVG